MSLADLYRAVESTLASKRLGTPVFVRYSLQTTGKTNGAATRLARMTAVARDWLGQELERIYALGSARTGHVTLTLEFRGGATGQITWANGARGGVDLMLLGNHGALYHDADLDGPDAEVAAKPEPGLLAWVERALRSGQPEAAPK